jgi:hypothetical protein
LAREFSHPVTAFAHHDELPEVRRRMARLRQEMDVAVKMDNDTEAAALRAKIRALRSRDPAEAAIVLGKEMQAAIKDERYSDAGTCCDDLRSVRRLLPKFNLAGLWKGFYPNHGDVTVRLRYRNDKIYATKVEGGGHVPVGEVTFCADVSDSSEKKAFDMIGFEVGDDDDFTVECTTNGTEVEQFRAAGRVARSGFRDANFVPGRLFILNDNSISFIWLPLGTVVVFTRQKERNHDDGDDTPDPNEQFNVTTEYPQVAIESSLVSIGDALDDIIKQAGNSGIFTKD